MGLEVIMGAVVNSVSMVNLYVNNFYVSLEKKQTLVWNGSSILKCNNFFAGVNFWEVW